MKLELLWNLIYQVITWKKNFITKSCFKYLKLKVWFVFYNQSVDTHICFVVIIMDVPICHWPVPKANMMSIMDAYSPNSQGFGQNTANIFLDFFVGMKIGNETFSRWKPPKISHIWLFIVFKYSKQINLV